MIIILVKLLHFSGNLEIQPFFLFYLTEYVQQLQIWRSMYVRTVTESL